ncbi:MAG TPA: PqqD family protein [Longimicrobiaceae bacterium]
MDTAPRSRVREGSPPPPFAMFGWLRKKRGDAGPAPLDAPFRRAEQVVSAAEGDRTVLLDPLAGEYYGLDEVGTRVWELLPAHPTAAALAERLFEEYDAPRDTLAADAAALLGKLAEVKLVVRA